MSTPTSQLPNDVNSLKELIDGFQKQNDRLQKQNEILQFGERAFKDLAMTLNTQVEHLKEETKSPNAQVEHLKEKIKSLEAQVEHSRRETKSPNAQVEHLKEKINSLETKVKHLSEENESLENHLGIQIQGHKDDLGRMNRKITKLMSDKEAAESEIMEIYARIDARRPTLNRTPPELLGYNSSPAPRLFQS